MATHLSIGTDAAVSLRCWGDFAIADAVTGADLRPRGRKARALIAYLAMHSDKPISRERLTALLWGDRAEEQARASLRQSLFELRHLANGIGLLAVDRDSVTLRSQAVRTDLQTMRDAVAASDEETLLAILPDPDETLFVNLDGIAPDFADWLTIERARQREALIALIADASARAIAGGRVRPARALHARLLEFEPESGTAVPAVPDLALPAVGHENRAAPQTSRRGVLAAISLAGVAGAGWWLGLRQSEMPSAEVRGLHETARQIIYGRKFAEFRTAEELLRRAVALDPGYAPAWSSLAAVVAMSDRSAAGASESERMARRAMSLDPDLAHAHGVLGMVLGFRPAEARAAIKRAARLAPRDPEILFWLSNVFNVEGNYAGRLDVLRRAAAIDPLWHRASGTAALAAWEMGFGDEADRYATTLRKHDVRLSYLCDYAVDWARGDYAAVVRDTLAIRPQLRSSDAADRKLGIALLTLGDIEQARLLLRLPPHLWEVARGGPVSAASFARINAEADTDEGADAYAEPALRQRLAAGGAEAIAALYARRTGRIGLLADPEVALSTLATTGPDVAVALRAAGREQDAESLMARVDASLRRSFAYGPVPNWLYAAAAQAAAVQGQPERALTSLATAIDRGWHYAPMTPLPDIAELPAFASVRAEPEFVALRKRLSDHLADQRRQVRTLELT